MAPRHSQGGFSLLEVLLAVSIAIALGSLQLGQIRRDTENIQARAVGEQLKMVGNALNSYITLQYGNITNLTDSPDPGTAADPGPRDCDASTRTCTIESTTLQRMGLLPSSFSGRNAYGSQYEYHIRVTGSAPNLQVEGMVFTREPYTIGGAPRFDLIGQAMLAAGADSGTTRTINTRIDGFNGSWSDVNYPTTELGQLAYRSGYGTSNYAAFLRLDGSTPMQSNLDMGNNDIENARNITAAGTVEAQSLQTDGAPAAVVMGDSVSATRGQIGVDGTRILLQNSGGVGITNLDGTTPTSLFAGNANFESLDVSGPANIGGTASITQSLSVGQEITSGSRMVAVNGFETTTGNILTSTGDIRTTNGNISATGASGGMINSRQLVVNEDARVTRSLLVGGGSAQWAFNSTSEMELSGADLRVLGNARVDGTIYAGGTLGTTGGLLMNGVQTAGSACATGTLPAGGAAHRYAPSSSGQLLQCIAGTWQAAGGINNSQTIAGTAVGSGGTSYANCPAGFKVAGGGFTLVFRGTVSDPYSPAASYADPGGNRWVVQAGAGHGSQFQASALCVN